MYRILRSYRVGDKIKYISFPISRENSKGIENTALKYALNTNKIECNLIRAKSKVRDYILCNDFKYFVTITCNNKKLNRFDLEQLRQYINDRIRYLRKIYNFDFKYILIPEKHKKGGWHFHGVFDYSLTDFIYINQNGYDSCSIFDNIRVFFG